MHPVHTLIFKNYLQKCLWNPNSRIHTKLQLPSLTNKKVRKTAHCVLSTAHCAPSAHLLWLKSSKIIYKNVFKIQIQACTQNYNSLASQTKKLEKQPTVHCLQPTVHPVHTYIFKNNLQKCLWNLNSSLHTKLQLPSLTNKKVRKTALCALSTAHCAPSAHLLWLKSSKIIYKLFMKSKFKATHKITTP